MLLAGGDEPSEALSGLQRITIVAALPFVIVMLLLGFALVKDLRRDPLALRARLATNVMERAIRTGVEQHGHVQFDLVTRHECHEGMSVVGYDNTELAETELVGLTSIDLHARELGRLAAAATLRRLNGNTTSESTRIEVDALLVVRRTSAAAPGN
jgi:hypothetical protein